MSWVYEALKRSKIDVAHVPPAAEEPLAAEPKPASTLPIPSNPPVAVFTENQSVSAPAWEDIPVETTMVRPVERLVAIAAPQSLAAEKFRMLATRLANLRTQVNLKVLHITSSVAGEGKSLVAANLSVALARRNKERVLLLEGDLRRMGIGNLFGMGRNVGLGEWWEGNNSELPQLYRVKDTQLWLLLAGKTERPTDLLQSGRLPKLIRRLAGMFDWVILDSPPLSPLVDANLLARWADGTLLVVREGVAPKKALQKGLESLDNPKIVGVALNDAAEGDRVYSYDRYYKLEPQKQAPERQTATTAAQ